VTMALFSGCYGPNWSGLGASQNFKIHQVIGLVPAPHLHDASHV
jgi:hypothetical protein